MRVIPETMGLFRDALTELGVVTYDADVTTTASGKAVLSIAQGVLVEVGDQWIRWMKGAWRWQVHPARHPRGAARLLAVHLADDPFLRLRVEFPTWSILRISEAQICAVPVGATALPVVETYSVDDLAVRLRAIEARQ